MLRSAAHLLAIVMLSASGRLLACGVECLDELTVPDQASCHQGSAPATAIGGGDTHACLPEVVEPRVTVAKLAADHGLLAAPLVARLVAPGAMPGHLTARYAPRTLFDSPHRPDLTVLRI